MFRYNVYHGLVTYVSYCRMKHSLFSATSWCLKCVHHQTLGHLESLARLVRFHTAINHLTVTVIITSYPWSPTHPCCIRFCIVSSCIEFSSCTIYLNWWRGIALIYSLHACFRKRKWRETTSTCVPRVTPNRTLWDTSAWKVCHPYSTCNFSDLCLTGGEMYNSAVNHFGLFRASKNYLNALANDHRMIHTDLSILNFGTCGLIAIICTGLPIFMYCLVDHYTRVRCQIE